MGETCGDTKLLLVKMPCAAARNNWSTSSTNETSVVKSCYQYLVGVQKQQLQSAKQEQQPQPDHPTSMSTQGHLVTAKKA